MTTTAPCPEARRRPTITWRLAAYHDGLDLIITVLDGAYHWRLDGRPAQSSPHHDYPRCLAAARLALGLPPIGHTSTALTA